MRSENSYQQESREEIVLHHRFIRPWRWCNNLDEGFRFKGKLVQGKLKTILLTNAQSVRIVFREGGYLDAPSNVPVEIVEVHSGCRMGDGDLVWHEGRYWRSEK